jgi:hypothetical protein
MMDGAARGSAHERNHRSESSGEGMNEKGNHGKGSYIMPEVIKNKGIIRMLG